LNFDFLIDENSKLKIHNSKLIWAAYKANVKIIVEGKYNKVKFVL
jgi:uncharacterized protein YycO